MPRWYRELIKIKMELTTKKFIGGMVCGFLLGILVTWCVLGTLVINYLI